MNIVAVGTKIRLMERFFEPQNYFFGFRLLFMKTRYYLLRFQHFERRRGVALALEMPQHMKAIGFALFTHVLPVSQR